MELKSPGCSRDQEVEQHFDSVCLFSGGLDSFVGAINLLEDGKSPLLVSHYGDASTSKQPDCADALKENYKTNPPKLVRANVEFPQNSIEDSITESTTRGRSFLFFALACLAADDLPDGTPIYVPENGLISLNVPLSPVRIGAWSTRTTHPFYMARWQDLIENLGIAARLTNPYKFMTKGEMLMGCRNNDLLKNNLEITTSCSSVSKARWKGKPPQHCGHCVPCLIRRASIKAVFDKDPTTYTLCNLNKRPLDSKRAESRDVRAFQMMNWQLTRSPDLADILIHKPGPLSDYTDDEIQKYADVFHRGILEVGKIVNKVKIQVS